MLTLPLDGKMYPKVIQLIVILLIEFNYQIHQTVIYAIDMNC